MCYVKDQGFMEDRGFMGEGKDFMGEKARISWEKGKNFMGEGKDCMGKAGYL